VETGNANPADVVLDSQRNDGWPDHGQQVDMLVSVDVARPDARADQLRVLCLEFAIHCCSRDAPRKDATDQSSVVIKEPALWSDQRSQRLGWRQWALFDQREMQADIQLGTTIRRLDAVVECLADHGERGARDDALSMCSLDSTIDILVQA
jgi:hypothetical protein